MKWTLSQLKKMQHTNNTFDETLDFKAFLEEGSDLIDIEETHVKGFFTIEENTYYHFTMTIDTVITMACAITLDPVSVPLHIEVVDTFTQSIDDEYHQVEGITIDLLPIIWSNIYLEKPLRVVSPNASFKSDKPHKKDDTVNPLFKDLEKYKK
jgi:uncharacterized protein